MSRKTNRETGRAANGARRDAISEYLTALEEIYPLARGTARVIKRQDNRTIVSVPLPMQARERMRLFDQMAEVGTKLLIETDEHIVLSSQ
jgi:predicted amidophosphoribosyltransferase